MPAYSPLAAAEPVAPFPDEPITRQPPAMRESRPPALVLPDPLALLHRPDSLDSDSSFDRDHDDDDDDDDRTVYGDKHDHGDVTTDDSDKERAYLVDPESGRGDHDSDDGWDPLSTGRKNRLRRRLLLIPAGIVGFLFVSFLSSSVLSAATGSHRYRGEGLKRITTDELANGTFWPEGVELEWVAEAGDGVFSQRTDDGSIVLTDLSANSSRTLVNGSDIKDENGDKLAWSRFKLSADMRYLLLDSEWTKVWRHSTLANFYLHPLNSSSSSSSPRTLPLLPPSSPPRTSLATFSPTSHHLAYVDGHDLFVLPAGEWEDGRASDAEAMREMALQVTEDGGETVFNGAPDWVYEEEIFSSDSALWWSPASDHLAFLSFDETDVPEYDYPVYNVDSAKAGGEPYPSEVRMRYPKPGYPNPRVSLRVFSLSTYLASTSTTTSSSSATSRAARIRDATHTLVLERPFPESNVIVTQVAWVGRDELLVKMTDRTVRFERVGLFDLSDEGLRGAAARGKQGTVVGRVVRETDWEEVDGGWAEPDQSVVGVESAVLLAAALPPLSSSSSPSSSDGSTLAARAPNPPSYPPGYLDVLPNPLGFRHLAYFSPASSSDPVWLTNGTWEIDGGIERVDVRRGLVYFVAANPSVARQVYAVPLPATRDALDALRGGASTAGSSEMRRLSGGAGVKGEGEDELAHYAVSVSPGGGVYQLNYEGPGVPWQKLFKADDPGFSLTLANNSALAARDAQYAHAQVVHSRISLPGTYDALGAGTGDVELDAMELRPPLMDLSGKTKYPVLFQVYGGPNSQTVTTRFQRDWHHYLAVSLGYVVVRVDPRGTGFRGRKFRTTVRKRLGEVEAQDVVAAATEWAKRSYIDEKRVGIWGWSYGGFLTTKVIEANSSVFQLGMAVAPVTDWRFYDSVYTERYMALPTDDDNLAGYVNSSVSNMEGFSHADFALAHGSGDDNVHFQNTANLLDRFTLAHIRRFRFRMFTDSDHSIRTRGAYWELMAFLEAFLRERFGEGGRTKSRWKLKVENLPFDPALKGERERE
ncbi:hypothetical protein JCM8208_000293 [Rhodotorula glutinis]